MRFVTDRIRVFLFGIVVAILGLWNPHKTVEAVAKALDV